jgi:hypothetical protein
MKCIVEGNKNCVGYALHGLLKMGYFIYIKTLVRRKKNTGRRNGKKICINKTFEKPRHRMNARKAYDILGRLSIRNTRLERIRWMERISSLIRRS